MGKVTQIELVKNHMLSGKSLSSMQAIRLFGCTRLADKIFRLKKQGYVIHKEMREGVSKYGIKYEYAVYTLISKGEKEVV